MGMALQKRDSHQDQGPSAHPGVAFAAADSPTGTKVFLFRIVVEPRTHVLVDDQENKTASTTPGPRDGHSSHEMFILSAP